jgi:hypothetical protein
MTAPRETTKNRPQLLHRIGRNTLEASRLRSVTVRKPQLGHAEANRNAESRMTCSTRNSQFVDRSRIERTAAQHAPPDHTPKTRLMPEKDEIDDHRTKRHFACDHQKPGALFGWEGPVKMVKKSFQHKQLEAHRAE